MSQLSTLNLLFGLPYDAPVLGENPSLSQAYFCLKTCGMGRDGGTMNSSRSREHAADFIDSRSSCDVRYRQYNGQDSNCQGGGRIVVMD